MTRSRRNMVILFSSMTRKPEFYILMKWELCLMVQRKELVGRPGTVFFVPELAHGGLPVQKSSD